MTLAKQMRLILAAATLSAVSAVCAAQAAQQTSPANSNFEQQEAAPIKRATPAENNYPKAAPGQELPQTTVPIPGVMLRVAPQSSVKQVSTDGEKLELRVERGVANVNVHDPAKDKVIVVDLPGGQTQLLKNGLYTFNAETNTARVLKGEALAFPQGAAADAKPLKVKEYNKVDFSGTNVKPHQFVPYEASVDLLPGPEGPRGDGGGAGYAYGYDGYGYGPYGDGFYGYPYYAYGPWGYPYGYGFYPYGVGLGFGYYGGFHGGYGFHGGGFRGGGGGHGRR
jgi:hypothetical protein